MSSVFLRKETLVCADSFPRNTGPSMSRQRPARSRGDSHRRALDGRVPGRHPGVCPKSTAAGTSSQAPTLIGAMELTLTAASLRGWPGDGVIAFINNRKESDAKRLGIPVVTLGGVLCDPSLPRVMVDHYAIGRVRGRPPSAMRFPPPGFLWNPQPLVRPPATPRVCRPGGGGKRALPATCSNRSPIPHFLATTARASPWTSGCGAWKLPAGIMAVHDYKGSHSAGGMPAARIACPARRGDRRRGQRHDGMRALPTRSEQRFSQLPGQTARRRCCSAVSWPQCQEIILPPDGVVAARSATDTIAVDDPYVNAVVHYARPSGRNLASHRRPDPGLRLAAFSRAAILASINCTPTTIFAA